MINVIRTNLNTFVTEAANPHLDQHLSTKDCKMHYRISDLPDSERPRERLLKTGVKSLSLTELLAILLRTGDATTHQSALTLAQTILKKAAALHQNPLVALQTVETQHINCSPSEEDKILTKRLIVASDQVQLNFIDHLVIGNPDYTSIRETTQLWNQNCIP